VCEVLEHGLEARAADVAVELLAKGLEVDVGGLVNVQGSMDSGLEAL
jgi:hypothetical protein